VKGGGVYWTQRSCAQDRIGTRVSKCCPFELKVEQLGY
jgi:hypothetical protein